MNISAFRALRQVSRRHFVRSTAAALGAGAAVGSGLWQPAQAMARRSSDPQPIPGGTLLLGGAFHLYGPGFPDFDPPDAEPSTITDFKGFVGLAYISGTVERTQRSTGERVTLPYLFNDMRFMDGVYRGMDGRLRRGTFGFI